MINNSNTMNCDIKQALEAIIGILLNPSKIQQGTLGEKITFLSSFGYDNQAIAKILNTTYSTVAKEKSIAKKVKRNE